VTTAVFAFSGGDDGGSEAPIGHEPVIRSVRRIDNALMDLLKGHVMRLCGALCRMCARLRMVAAHYASRTLRAALFAGCNVVAPAADHGGSCGVIVAERAGGEETRKMRYSGWGGGPQPNHTWYGMIILHDTKEIDRRGSRD
jgi:hypothetical protein